MTRPKAWKRPEDSTTEVMPTSVKLPPRLREELERVALAQNRAMGSIIKEALEDYLRRARVARRRA